MLIYNRKLLLMRIVVGLVLITMLFYLINILVYRLSLLIIRIHGLVIFRLLSLNHVLVFLGVLLKILTLHITVNYKELLILLVLLKILLLALLRIMRFVLQLLLPGITNFVIRDLLNKQQLNFLITRNFVLILYNMNIVNFSLSELFFYKLIFKTNIY